ncbi:DUF4239 domain-containing protein [Nocardia sp. NBC_01503]|uniref:bestrophin-like domain n=1 Tax=Nocardia sp. NBC_01503 TaxID=2975997 RepID=UPI002E7BA846|nr:DUF4239 domain-containing protein [Nocardia sp. NBC_01503]WTL32049.1 DUF4239 domain-containing protein [Nocardia sp. NBC_01503]
MSWASFAMIVPVLTVAGGIPLLRRSLRRGAPSDHNEVAGLVFQVIGALYAVLLAFVVVNEWNSLQEARGNTFSEANELGALYWNTRALPPEFGRDLEATTKQYARVVIDKEWPRLARGEYSPEATALVYRMREQINALPSDTPSSQSVYEHSLSTVNDLAAARRERLSQSGHNVPPALWMALALGAVVTVGFTFVFGLPKFWTHLLLGSSLAVLIMLVMALIQMLDQPFAGSIAVQPDAFEIFLRDLPAQR